MLEGRPEGLSRERTLALLTIDADSIQRTLLATPRPVTIYGASTTLAKWDEDLRAMRAVSAEVTVLFAGGGSAVLAVPLARAEQIGREIEDRYARAMHARATSAFIACSPAELVEGPRVHDGATDDLRRLGLAHDGGGFSGCLANLAFTLRKAKLAARPHPDVPEETSGLRCSETGDRPRDRDTLSRFAHHHRHAGASKRGALEQARSFEDVLDGARRLAFICLDGARIGTLLTEVRTLGAYAELSRRLDSAFSSVRDPMVRDELGLAEGRYQVILAGGDDLLLVVPAAGDNGRPDALTLTSKLVRKIEQAFEGTGWNVGVGAGVLITTGGLPARIAFDYARALCDSAKRAIDGASAARSGVDFEVVLAGAPLSSTIEKLRKDRARRVVDFPALGKRADFRDTQRPYDIDRFDALLEVGEAVRNVGQSTLATFTRALQGDLNTALIDIHYQLARASGVRTALGIQRVDPGQPNEWILEQMADGAYATALIDLAEITKLRRHG